jgi:hypothetical protein
MCIFTQSVRRVSATKIFARLTGDRQHLAYEMRLASRFDVAMILPLPTQLANEDQASFVDLSDYSSFFDDMDRCFPEPLTRGFHASAVSGANVKPLVVHRVGAFDASFVPALSDFPRLDARFRLPDNLWSQFPLYSDFGFAVFQFRAGDSRVHPMALSFSTRNRTSLFFPTAHVHDGAVHPFAHFDHSLYAQGQLSPTGWVQGSVLPRDVMNFGNFALSDRTRGLVDSRAPIVRRDLWGAFPNHDTWLHLTDAG